MSRIWIYSTSPTLSLAILGHSPPWSSTVPCSPLAFKPLLTLCSCMAIPSIPFPLLSVQLTLQVCILWGSVLPLPCRANQHYSLPSLGFPNNCRLYEYNVGLIIGCFFFFLECFYCTTDWSSHLMSLPFNASFNLLSKKQKEKENVIKSISKVAFISNILCLHKILNYSRKRTPSCISLVIPLV